MPHSIAECFLGNLCYYILKKMLNFSLLTSLVLISSFLLSFRLFPKAREYISSLLSYTFFFFISTIIGIQVLLGIFGILNAFFLSIAVYSWTILIVLITGKYFVKNYTARPKNIFSFLMVLVFGFLLLFIFIEFFNALIQPVWEYDSIAYHLPFVRYWLASGSMQNALFTPYAGPVGYYPASGEVITLWNILPVKADFLANIQNIFLLICFAVTSYDFARKIGLSRAPSLLFPILFLHSPIILKEVGSAHVDLFFALSFLYTIYFIAEYIFTRDARTFITIGLSLGLFVGSKYLALPYAILLGIILIFYVLKNIFREKIQKKQYLLFIMLAVIGFFLVGGFWYIRNYYLASNPVFPAEVKIGSYLLFKGYGSMTDQILNWSLIKNLDTLQELKFFLGKYLLRTGWQTYLIIISYFLGLLLFIIQKPIRKTTLVFLITIPLFFYIYLITPYTYNDLDANIRYSILFLLIGALFVAYIAEHIKILRPVIYLGTLAAIFLTLYTALRMKDLPHELFNLSFIKQYPGIFAFYSLKIAIGIFVGMWILRQKKHPKLGIISILLITPFFIFLGNAEIFRVREEQRFTTLQHKYSQYKNLIHAFEWFDKNTLSSESVAYSGFHFYYPLFGTHLDKKVQYISVNSCENCNYVDYNNQKQSIMSEANRQAWTSNLTDAKIEYLILFDQIGYLKYEPKWVTELPQKFQKVFEEEKVRIFSYLP